MFNPVFAAEDVVKDITALLIEFPQLADDEELLRDTLEGIIHRTHEQTELLGQRIGR